MDQGPPVTPESSEQAPAGHGRVIGFPVIALPALLLLYVLSIGPVAKLSKNPPKLLKTFYWPLLYLDGHSKIAHRFLEWYIGDLWKVD